MATFALGGITLDPDLVWSDRWEGRSVQHEVDRTLSGNFVVFHRGLSKGQPVTLEASEDSGWATMTRTKVEQLKAMADSAGAVYSLQVDGESFSVMFRHSEPPAFDAEPIIPRLEHDAADLFRVTIKLVKV